LNEQMNVLRTSAPATRWQLVIRNLAATPASVHRDTQATDTPAQVMTD